MSKFQQIKEIIAQYQQQADKIINEYKQKLEYAKDRYSKSVYMDKAAEILAKHGGALLSEQCSAKNEVEILVEEIESDFRKWMTRPIKADILQTLAAIKEYGVTLTRSELEVFKTELQESFFGLQILSKIAEKAGFYIPAPKMQDFTRELKDAKAAAINAVTAYSGKNLEGKDLLDNVPVWAQTSAALFLEQSSTLDDAENMWREAHAPAGITLSEDESRRICDLTKSLSKERQKKMRIETLESIEPGITDKLSLLSGDYLEAMQQYIDTGFLGKLPEDATK